MNDTGSREWIGHTEAPEDLEEWLENPPGHYEGEGYSRQDEAFLDRVIEEILSPVDFYWAGNGPEGPWRYRSLTVERTMNRVYISDVDGATVEYLEIPDLSGVKEPEAALKRKLEEVNRRSLEAL